MSVKMKKEIKIGGLTPLKNWMHLAKCRCALSCDFHNYNEVCFQRKYMKHDDLKNSIQLIFFNPKDRLCLIEINLFNFEIQYYFYFYF